MELAAALPRCGPLGLRAYQVRGRLAGTEGGLDGLFGQGNCQQARTCAGRALDSRINGLNSGSPHPHRPVIAQLTLPRPSFDYALILQFAEAPATRLRHLGLLVATLLMTPSPAVTAGAAASASMATASAHVTMAAATRWRK